MADFDPSRALHALRGKSWNTLNAEDRSSVCRAVRRLADPLNAMAEEDFSAAFDAFLAADPEHFYAGVGEILQEEDVLQLEELVLGGDPPIATIPFPGLGLDNTEVVVELPENTPPGLTGNGSTANVFRRNVRLIANVLMVLKVSGRRVIRDETLLDLVRHRRDDGRLTIKSVELLNYMNTVTGEELWGPDGWPLIIKKYYSVNNNVQGENLVVNQQMQIDVEEGLVVDPVYFQIGLP